MCQKLRFCFILICRQQLEHLSPREACHVYTKFKMGDTADTAAATTLANVWDHRTEGKQSHQCGLKHRLLLLLLLFYFIFFSLVCSVCVSFIQALFAVISYLCLHVVLFLLGNICLLTQHVNKQNYYYYYYYYYY